jgi:hypothetical protein
MSASGMKAEDTLDPGYFPIGRSENQSAEKLIFGEKYTDFARGKP